MVKKHASALPRTLFLASFLMVFVIIFLFASLQLQNQQQQQQQQRQNVRRQPQEVAVDNNNKEEDSGEVEKEEKQQRNHLNSRSNFTNYRCVNGQRSVQSERTRSCEFENICLSIPSYEFKTQKLSENWEPVKWFYFVSPDEVLSPFFDDNGLINRIPEDTDLIKSHVEVPGKYVGPFVVKFNMVYEPDGIQSLATKQGLEVVWIDTPTIVATPVSGNFGHIIADELFPAWLLTKFFEKDEIQYMTLWNYDTEGYVEVYNRIMNELLPAISPYPRLAPQTSEPFVSYKDNSNSTLFCFRSLLTGTSSMAIMLTTTIQGLLWSEFRGKILRHYGYDPIEKPSKQKILIWSKGEGLRNPDNLEELALFLSSTFGVEVELVTFDAKTEMDVVKENVRMRYAHYYSLQEQLQIISSASVVITPCGGISFIDLLQPKDSVQIVIDFWNPDTNRPDKLEGALWTAMPHIQTWHYMFTEEEVVYHPLFEEMKSKPQPGYPEHLRNYLLYKYFTTVHVNLERMALYVQAALLNGERKFGFRNSFKKLYSLDSSKEEIERLFGLLRPDMANKKDEILSLFQ